MRSWRRSLLFFLVFMALPVVWLFYLSFQHDGILAPAQFAGLDNWRRTFSDGLVLKCIGNTLYYCAMAIPTVFVLGMIVALSLSVVRRGAALLRIIIYFPTLQASLIVALIWTFVIHPDFGLLNLGIRALTGVKLNFLGDPHFAMPTIAMIEVWKGLGFLGDTFPLGIACAPPRPLSRRRAGRSRTDPPLFQPHFAADEADLLFRGHFRHDRQPAAVRFRVRSDRRRPGRTRPRPLPGTSTAASSPSPIRASARRCPSCLSSSFSR